MAERFPFAVGDVVVAIKDGGADPHGFPKQRPVRGAMYRITSIYRAPYGYGCTLAGMDPAPYVGYFLLRRRKRSADTFYEGYFSKIKAADKEFTELLRSFKPKKRRTRKEKPDGNDA